MEGIAMREPQLAADLSLRTRCKRGENRASAEAAGWTPAGLPGFVFLDRYKEGLRLTGNLPPRRVLDIHFSQIASIELAGQGTYTEQRSVVGRAIIGKAVAGETGALVGALSGLQPKVSTTNEYSITYWDVSHGCWRTQTLMTSGYDQPAMVMNLAVEDLNAYRQGIDPETLPNPYGDSPLDAALKKYAMYGVGAVVAAFALYAAFHAAVYAAKVAFTLAFYALLVLIAPGAVTFALAVELAELNPPRWLAYVVAAALSGLLLWWLYVRQGKDRKKALQAYAWFCVPIGLVFVLAWMTSAPWHAPLLGHFTGQQVRWTAKNEAAWQQQVAARLAGNSQPVATGASQPPSVAAPTAAPTAPAVTVTSQTAAATEAGTPTATATGSETTTTTATAAPVASAGIQGETRGGLVPPQVVAPLPEQTVVAKSSTDASAAPRVESPRPSFDCAKAREWAEHRVCASHELASLDRKMNELYVTVFNKLGPASSVRRDQLAWIEDRRGCKDDQCLSVRYQNRIHQLTVLAQP